MSCRPRNRQLSGGLILAAMASTSKGNALIQNMLGETTATVVTDLSGVSASSLSNPPAA